MSVSRSALSFSVCPRLSLTVLLSLSVSLSLSLYPRSVRSIRLITFDSRLVLTILYICNARFPSNCSCSPIMPHTPTPTHAPSAQAHTHTNAHVIHSSFCLYFHPIFEQKTLIYFRFISISFGSTTATTKRKAFTFTPNSFAALDGQDKCFKVRLFSFERVDSSFKYICISFSFAYRCINRRTTIGINHHLLHPLDFSCIYHIFCILR
jgi:hypothetical protein